MHNWTIYMYTFSNGKRYIGATQRSLYLRQGSQAGGWSRYRNCRLIWEAIQEFGTNNIEQTILFQGQISDKEAAEMERYYIALYKTNANRYKDPTYGYNLTDGGESISSKHLTEERLGQLRDQMKVFHRARKGTQSSEETRRRLSLAKRGKKRGPLSEETKRKIGFANSLESITPEERQHRSDSKKQSVTAYNPQTGERLFFYSHMEAADYFGVRDSSITRWLNGSRTPRNGFVFMSAAGLEATA